MKNLALMAGLKCDFMMTRDIYNGLLFWATLYILVIWMFYLLRPCYGLLSETNLDGSICF